MTRFTLVAECGVNWNTIEEAKLMISRAAEAGASHVKFQAYTDDDIVALPVKVREHLKRIMLADDSALELKTYAEDIGVTWFATPTTTERVDMLERIGVTLYKVRTRDSDNQTLLKRIWETNKKMFISAERMTDNWDLRFAPRVTWLFCIPHYPVSLGDYKLHDVIPLFKGLSCHTPDIAIPLYAATLGAKVLECHVTLSHERNDVDAAVSIDFDELATLAKLLKSLDTLLPREEIDLFERAFT